jgi:hypothetical protein
MDLQTRLLVGLVGLLLAAGALGGVWWHGHHVGDASGAARVQAQWDDAVKKSEAETARVRAEGYTLAAEYEAQVHELEQRSARFPLTAANNRQVTCPKSGKVGDVLLPADLVDGMFLRAAEPAASGPRTR